MLNNVKKFTYNIYSDTGHELAQFNLIKKHAFYISGPGAKEDRSPGGV